MDMPFQTFLTPERTDLFFDMLKHVLFYVAPLIMIGVAVSLVGWLIWIIRKSFNHADNDDNDDDDVEVYRY